MAKLKKIKLDNTDNDFSGSKQDEFIKALGGDDSVSGGKGNDKIKGGEGNDVIRGGADDDTLNGQAGDDTVLGGAGDDTITAMSGNDTVDGGIGDDLVKIAGNLADATIVMDGDYYAITINGVTTKVKNVELFQFADGTATAEEIDDIANPPVPVNLTVGQDTFVGTAEDDVFSAAAVNPVSGLPATTLNAFDSVDGGEGNDRLDIFVSSTGDNTVQQGTIKNIETINLYADGGTTFGTGSTFDASKFVGATTINQIGGTAVSAVTGLEATQTAGFKDQTATVNMNVTAAATAASASIALSNVLENSALFVSGEALNTVSIAGNVIDGPDALTDVTPLITFVTAGKDQQTLTVNSEAALQLIAFENGASTKMITTLDASGSTGAITFTGDADLATIKGGSGNDTLVNVAATTATIAASLTGGDGKDTLIVSTSGAGTTTVDGGLGNDTVNIAGRSTGKLTVSLGDGDDTFTTSVAINGTDAIDGGAGTDALQLKVVGVANIGAFSNFEVFDAVGMTNDLDVAILATKNTVTEIITSGAIGAAGVDLINLGAGVGFRATGDMGGTSIALTQAAAGALNITLDADEVAPAGAVEPDAFAMDVVSTNATSLTATFASDFLDKSTGAGDNIATIDLDGVAATVAVVSGGTNASLNTLNYTDISAGPVDALTTVTVTGATALDLNVAGAGKLATVDASASTGGLTFDLADFAASGTVKLGSGVDTLTVLAADYTNGLDTVVGFEKAAAVAGSTLPADAVAAAAAQADADTLLFAGATVASAQAVAGGTVANGVLTFDGAGPATLAAAVAIANLGAETAGEALVFEYLGDTYAFVQGAADTLVELDGVTGVTKFLETAVDEFFVI